MARQFMDDKIWSKLFVLLPKKRGCHGKNDRLFLEATYWILRTGAPWRDLPLEFGPWKSVYNRYNRWVKRGWFDAIFKELKKRFGQRATYD